MDDQYERIVEESKQLANRMRSKQTLMQMAQELLLYYTLKTLPPIT
jgi:hypothetical protein